jgi:aminopeptidase-like protein
MDLIQEIESYLSRLFPIARSIAGPGSRESLRVLQEIVPLNILEYPSGATVYDWIIPREWEVRSAFVKNSRGEKVIDFRNSNLHVMGFSRAVHQKIVLEDLEPHLHYLPDMPDAIPYRTTYYQDGWGFCLTYHQYQALIKDEGPFEVFIDSSFKDGSLTVGELLIKGESEQEVLISTYICHPSLANDNLSGMILTAFLARELLSRKNLKRSYRIVFVPETIGAITYCAMNEMAMKAIDIGLVVTTVGGPGKFGYKQSFDQSHYINKLIEEILLEGDHDFITYPFDIHGSDERQYSSPGFRINAATICKDKYYEYPYYHTSLDNLDFVKAEYIYQTLQVYLRLIDKLELTGLPTEVAVDVGRHQAPDSSKALCFRSQPHCEIMLSKHNLYPETGGKWLPGEENGLDLDLILWLLFYCDGTHNLESISKKIGAPLDKLEVIAFKLEKKGILKIG